MSKKTSPLSGRERMRRYHARNRQCGMTRVMVLVPVEGAQQIRDLAHALRAQRQIDRAFQPEDNAP